jgi:NitT/TauT family transport system substrate-binding protein
MRVVSRFAATVSLGIAAAAFALGSSAQELPNINIITPGDKSCGQFPKWTGTILGFYEDSGVKVTTLTAETTVPYVAFLQNGDADLVMLDSSQVLQAVATGLPIKVLYEAYNYSPEGIVVTADSPIQSIAELKDATIGMASDRDLITTVIAFDSIGETLESMNVKTVVVGDSGPVMAAALRDKTIDAFSGGSGDRAGIEAAGVQIRNITPPEVSRNPGNSLTAWGPTLEEKRDIISKFLRGWSMAQHAGVVDTMATAAACRTKNPQQFENLDAGLRLINTQVYVGQLRRTKYYGELQPDVWRDIQGPLQKIGEISQSYDPATFLDSSFIEAANSWELDEVKAGINNWKKANPDKLIKGFRPISP